MTNAESTRVLIVDDDVVLAEALSLVWERENDLQITGVAHTGAEALALARRDQPDVILMDHHLPDMTGADATGAICAEQPSTSVVMLTIDSSDDALLAAMQAGASGFLLKSSGVSAVTEAVRRAARGETILPAATMTRLMVLIGERRQRQTEQEQLVGRLTARELEVLRLMARGLDTKAMTEELVVSQTTVRTHVASVLSKLGAHSRLEAVARAAEVGLIQR